jgi:hypothetical protein
MTPQQSGQQQQLMVDTTCGSLLRELQVCFLVCSSNICKCCVLACVFKRIGYFHTRGEMYLRAHETKNERDVPKSCKKGSDN